MNMYQNSITAFIILRQAIFLLKYTSDDSFRSSFCPVDKFGVELTFNKGFVFGVYVNNLPRMALFKAEVASFLDDKTVIHSS